MRDFYLLVTICHSHTHPDRVPTGTRAQFLLHRLRLGRSDLVQQARSPFGVVKVSATYAVVVWLLFIYDMRLIRAGVSESTNDAERNLYARARGEQLLNIWLLVPLLFVFNLGCAVAIWTRPDLFLARRGHVRLISAQLISFIVYLAYIARYFKTIAPLVLRSRQGD